ncbi:MAG: hypothetical protein LUG18_12810 [Candidatus Azobacteroides sp.]|nr:hypothetical protein [Candidatus Azobacteroides sp.]
MQKVKFNLIATFIFLSFLFTSCFGGATYWIDNPTNETIEVSIDGKDPVTVGPGEFKKMSGTLNMGEHTMKITGGEDIKFNLDKDHVTLNPTLSTYIIGLQEYGRGRASGENDTIIEIDGVKFQGPFPLVTNDPFIYTGNVNFLVDAPFKDEITTSKTGTVTMRKLFRKHDFIEFYKKNYR